jgi:hypothetical protein
MKAWPDCHCHARKARTCAEGAERFVHHHHCRWEWAIQEKRMFGSTTVLAAAAFVIVSASGSYAASFNSAVEKVLVQQKEIKELDSAARGQMVACVQKVLAEVPGEKQSYVAEAANFEEMEDRFGEVVLANQAEFKQMITKECGSIVMEN